MGQSEGDPRRTSPIVVFLASNLCFSLFTYFALHSYYHLLQTFPPNYCVLKSGRALKAPFPLCASCRGKT